MKSSVIYSLVLMLLVLDMAGYGYGIEFPLGEQSSEFSLGEHFSAIPSLALSVLELSLENGVGYGLELSLGGIGLAGLIAGGWNTVVAAVASILRQTNRNLFVLISTVDCNVKTPSSYQ